MSQSAAAIKSNPYVKEGYTPTPTLDAESTIISEQVPEQPAASPSMPPPNDGLCMKLIRNCLGVIFPKLLEGLTHPDQRDSLPSRNKKRKDQKQYERVNNEGEEDEEDEADEESKGAKSSGEGDGTASTQDDQNQFFNEFQSWRSNHSNQAKPQGAKGATELQETKAKKSQNQKSLITLSENEIEQQRNMVFEESSDLFKDFESQKQVQQKKLVAPPQNQRVKTSTSPSKTQTKAPHLTDLFQELESSLSSSAQASQFSMEINTQNAQQTQNDNQTDKNNANLEEGDILEEKGWDDELSINIE